MVLVPPPDWVHVAGRDPETLLRPPEPGLTVWVWPLMARGTVDLRKLIEHDRPPLGRVEIVQTIELPTTTGWRMSLVTALVHGNGELLETRLAGLYEVLHWAGLALAVATDSEVYERHRQTLVEMFTAARPDLHGREPLCVRDLWDMDQR